MVLRDHQSLAHSKATPLSFHLEGGSLSVFRFTLKIRYLSVLFAYLYTGQLYTDLSSPDFFLFMAVTCSKGNMLNIYLGRAGSKEFLCHLQPSKIS